jgi:aminomethyltransferase
MIISRTGYTGEPGFELYFDRDYSEDIWDIIFENGESYGLGAIGLGARDTLRLEKKYCLYGNDIDQTTNPLEAGLGWITKLDKEDFIGKSALQEVKAKGISRKLVGFTCEGRMIPRHHYEIVKNDRIVGSVTSGCYSPILDKNIGLGYINIEETTIGSQIIIKARGRQVEGQIVKTPFV